MTTSNASPKDVSRVVLQVPDKPSFWIELGFAALCLALGMWLAAGVERGAPTIVLPEDPAEVKTFLDRLKKGDLKESQKEALTTFREIEKLLFSLTSLLIAGIVTLVAKDGTVRPTPRRPARLVLIATFLAAALSLYFGYFTQIRLLEVLELGHFSVHSEQIWEPLQWQYRFFLAGVCGMATFVMLVWLEGTPPVAPGDGGGSETSDSSIKDT